MTTEATRALAEYLRSAEPIDYLPLVGGGGHGRKRAVRLEGGILAVAKYGDPASLDGQASLQVHAEAAAWILAQELGWADLVPTTVIRTLPDPDDATAEVVSSVQIHVARFETSIEGNFSAADVPEEFLQRCAVFDVIAANSDRNNSNWGQIAGSNRPILIDHGHAFEATGAVVGAGDFITQALGDDIDSAVLDHVEEFVAHESNSGIEALIGADKSGRLFARARSVVASAVVRVP